MKVQEVGIKINAHHCYLRLSEKFSFFRNLAHFYEPILVYGLCVCILKVLQRIVIIVCQLVISISSEYALFTDAKQFIKINTIEIAPSCNVRFSSAAKFSYN